MVLSRLFTGARDPAVRYEVAARVRDQLPWVQAVSAAQIVEEGGFPAATERLGKSRQYLDRLMREHD
jgi:hypothetical protein